MLIRVKVSGFRETMDAIKAADKKAEKVIRDKITAAGKDVTAAASYLTPYDNPLSGWGSWFSKGRDLSYSGGSASGGFKLRRSNFRRGGVSYGLAWDVYQSNAGGNIFIVVGDKSRVSRSVGEPGGEFVDYLNARFARPSRGPRVLLPAYYTRMTEAFRDSIAADIEAEARRLGLD